MDYELVHSWLGVGGVHSLLCVSDACGCLRCRVVALSMSPVDDTFISGSLDKTIRLWDLRSPNCQVGYQIHAHSVLLFQLRDEK